MESMGQTQVELCFFFAIVAGFVAMYVAHHSEQANQKMMTLTRQALQDRAMLQVSNNNVPYVNLPYPYGSGTDIWEESSSDQYRDREGLKHTHKQRRYRERRFDHFPVPQNIPRRISQQSQPTQSVDTGPATSSKPWANQGGRNNRGNRY